MERLKSTPQSFNEHGQDFYLRPQNANQVSRVLRIYIFAVIAASGQCLEILRTICLDTFAWMRPRFRNCVPYKHSRSTWSARMASHPIDDSNPKTRSVTSGHKWKIAFRSNCEHVAEDLFSTCPTRRANSLFPVTSKHDGDLPLDSSQCWTVPAFLDQLHGRPQHPTE